jgi:hypothetical protein
LNIVLKKPLKLPNPASHKSLLSGNHLIEILKAAEIYEDFNSRAESSQFLEIIYLTSKIG